MPESKERPKTPSDENAERKLYILRSEIYSLYGVKYASMVLVSLRILITRGF